MIYDARAVWVMKEQRTSFDSITLCFLAILKLTWQQKKIGGMYAANFLFFDLLRDHKRDRVFVRV